MKLSHFRYDLPLNLIAQRPTPRREDSKLLVVNKKTGEMQNKHFKDSLNPIKTGNKQHRGSYLHTYK